MAISLTGSLVNWQIFWLWVIGTGLGCAAAFTVLYRLRKSINRATAALWIGPWVALHARTRTLR